MAFLISEKMIKIRVELFLKYIFVSYDTIWDLQELPFLVRLANPGVRVFEKHISVYYRGTPIHTLMQPPITRQLFNAKKLVKFHRLYRSENDFGKLLNRRQIEYVNNLSAWSFCGMSQFEQSGKTDGHVNFPFLCFQ